jgi:hypothetical protein
MGGGQPKGFGGKRDGESAGSNEHMQGLDEPLPKRRKSRHRKFIDLQKQPPKPKPVVQD